MKWHNSRLLLHWNNQEAWMMRRGITRWCTSLFIATIATYCNGCCYGVGFPSSSLQKRGFVLFVGTTIQRRQGSSSAQFHFKYSHTWLFLFTFFVRRALFLHDVYRQALEGKYYSNCIMRIASKKKHRKSGSFYLESVHRCDCWQCRGCRDMMSSAMTASWWKIAMPMRKARKALRQWFCRLAHCTSCKR